MSSTDYGNYSKQLASAREKFASSKEQIKNNYDESLKNVNDTHEKREKDNKILNEERRQELIEQNQEQLTNVNEKANRTLNIKQKEFMETLRGNDDEFRNEKKSIKDHLENKLDRAKEAFSQSLKQVKDSNEVQSREKDKNFAQTISTNRDASDQKINNVEKNTTAALAKNKEDVAIQKREANKKHEIEKSEQFKRMRSDTDRKTDSLSGRIDQINKNKAQEINHLNEKNAQTLLIKKKDALENLDKIENTYKNRNQDAVNDFQSRFENLEEQSKEKLDKVTYQATLENKAKEKEKALYLDKNVREQDKDNKQTVLKENYEKRFDSLKKQMAEQAQLYNRRSSEANNETLSKLKLYEDDAKGRIADNKIQHHDDFETLRLTSKLTSDNNQSEYNKQLATMAKDNDLKNEKEKKLSKDTLSRKQLIHEKEQGQIADINLKNIERIKNEAQRERTSLKTNAIKELSDNVFVVKQNYQKKFDKTLEGYQQKFEEQDKMLEKIQEISNDKIGEIQNKTDRQLEASRERDKAEREMERAEFMDRYTQLKDSYEEKFKNQKKDFDKELARSRKENNMIVTTLAKKNNEEVRNLMESQAREMKRASDELRKEKDRNFKTANAEKEYLVERYESKMDELKSAYETDKMRISENKRSERT